MTNPITILVPIKLAKGKTEADLVAASNKFQNEFAGKQPGLIRRELIRKTNGEYLDIVQFRSKEDAEDIIKKEQTSPACHEFFSVIEMSVDADEDEGIEFYQSLVTYT